MAIVYQHRRLDTNEIFYIGIGVDKRRPYSKRDRNKHWHNIVKKCGYIVEIIHTNISWDIACRLEKKYIKHYGRRDLGLGPLVNMTDGGDGSVGVVVSEETRKKKREANIRNGNKPPSYKGKKESEETRKKKSEINKGKKLSEETKKKISDANTGRKSSRRKKVAQLDKNTNEIIKVWDSATEAGKELKIVRRNISLVCEGKKNRPTAGGFKWKYYEA